MGYKPTRNSLEYYDRLWRSVGLTFCLRLHWCLCTLLCPELDTWNRLYIYLDIWNITQRRKSHLTLSILKLMSVDSRNMTGMIFIVTQRRLFQGTCRSLEAIVCLRIDLSMQTMQEIRWLGAVRLVYCYSATDHLLYGTASARIQWRRVLSEVKSHLWRTLWSWLKHYITSYECSVYLQRDQLTSTVIMKLYAEIVQHLNLQ